MRSMTGFGTGRVPGDGGCMDVEVRSYNHRFLDVKVRVPRLLQPLEPLVVRWARERLVRGRVEIGVRWEEVSEDALPLRFNPAAVRFYLDVARELREQFGVPGELDVGVVLGLRETVRVREELPEVSEVWPRLEEALEEALQGLAAMQGEEGRRIGEDLLQRFRFLEARLATVKGAAAAVPEAQRQRLESRIRELAGPEVADPQRLAQEIVIAADKMDITEEIVRLESHIEVCVEGLQREDVAGKRLDFLAQEILRELNTIGAKSGDTEILYAVVDMKTELEKIREQAQNIQ